ncbi:unnamed protein product [Effrenium voratum]|nr:unnamed protein product [Effrenium voratum]
MLSRWRFCWTRYPMASITTPASSRSFVALPQTDLALRRVWLEVAEVWPLGYAALRALHQMERPEMVLNCSGKKGETIQAVLELLHRDEVLCEVSPEQVVCEGQAFSAQQFFGAVQNDGMISSSFLLKPDRMSFLHKLSSLRESLLLPSSARLAAETMGAAKPPQCLPTFPDLLSGAWVVEPAVNSTATPEQHESLIDCGSLSSVAEAFLVHKVLRLPGLDSALEEPEVPEAAKAIYDSFTAQFPKDAEGLIPNDEDLINLARTSPLALWVFGQCDSGAYKTEACRRLADKLQLQWLQPAYVLELATKTPAAHRSPLQRRCVEQLQRGMTVSVGDALRLTMEMMSSALCKANGYILDFPAVTQEELPEVLDFFGKVKELSGKTEVPWGEVLEETPWSCRRWRRSPSRPSRPKRPRPRPRRTRPRPRPKSQRRPRRPKRKTKAKKAKQRTGSPRKGKVRLRKQPRRRARAQLLGQHLAEVRQRLETK